MADSANVVLAFTIRPPEKRRLSGLLTCIFQHGNCMATNADWP
jgi:hypothetical protein